MQKAWIMIPKPCLERKNTKLKELLAEKDRKIDSMRQEINALKEANNRHVTQEVKEVLDEGVLQIKRVLNDFTRSAENPASAAVRAAGDASSWVCISNN